jgi:3-deoxy-D-manno-octulosonic-acid transferase
MGAGPGPGLDRVLAQTAEDAGRLKQAGAPEPIVTGNLKFDLVLPAAQVQAGKAWRTHLGRPEDEGRDTRRFSQELNPDAVKLVPRAGP